jgi:hypothetical protein
MSEQQQNGKPQMPQIPEGDLFLLVRLNPKTQEFQCLFGDLVSGIALHKLGGAFLENIQRQMFAGPQIQTAPLPGFDPKMLSHFKRGPGGN